MAYCVNCGAQLPDGATFCTQCGSSQTASAEFNPYAVGANYSGANSAYDSTAPGAPTFREAISICFRKYAVFRGRASRSEFWYWFLFVWLVNFLTRNALNLVTVILPIADLEREYKLILIVAFSVVAIGVGLGLLLPTVSVFVRRMHDTNHSGWLGWLPLLPSLGMGGFLAFADAAGFNGDKATEAAVAGVFAIVILAAFLYPFFLALRPGDPGDNQYGPAPVRL